MLVRISNRKDPDQKQSDLGLHHCLSCSKFKINVTTEVLDYGHLILHAGWFLMLLLSSADIFSKLTFADIFSKLTFSKKSLRNIISLSSRLDPVQDSQLWVLISVQTVCRDHQQMTKFATTR